LGINAKKGLRKPILIDEFQNKKMIFFLKHRVKTFTETEIKEKWDCGKKLNTYCWTFFNQK
tara:strand:+ start:158 stop:340 length:183 start_codon:yes stop_codon:yes gene_type:complete